MMFVLSVSLPCLLYVYLPSAAMYTKLRGIQQAVHATFRLGREKGQLLSWGPWALELKQAQAVRAGSPAAANDDVVSRTSSILVSFRPGGGAAICLREDGPGTQARIMRLQYWGVDEESHSPQPCQTVRQSDRTQNNPRTWMANGLSPFSYPLLLLTLRCCLLWAGCG